MQQKYLGEHGTPLLLEYARLEAERKVSDLRDACVCVSGGGKGWLSGAPRGLIRLVIACRSGLWLRTRTGW